MQTELKILIADLKGIFLDYPGGQNVITLLCIHGRGRQQNRIKGIRRATLLALNMEEGLRYQEA